MKKVYDWNISVSFYLLDTKQTISMMLSVHTTFKEIGHKLSEVLGMDSFSTYFDFYIPDQANSVNPTQNLKQNNVSSGMKINVKLHGTQQGYPTSSHYVNENKLISHDEYHLYNPKTRQQTYGLIIEGMCQNQKCINYCKDMTIPLGFGEFALNHIYQSLKVILNKYIWPKCPTCPYKDRKLDPSIVVKNIKLNNCQWRCYGTYREKLGFITSKEFPLFKKVEGESNAQLYKMIEGYSWVDLKLIIKTL